MDLTHDGFSTQNVNTLIRGKHIMNQVSTSEQNIIENIEMNDHFCDRDHIIIRWDLVRKTKIDELLHKRISLCKGHYIQMREHLRKVKFQDKLNIKRVEETWYVFKQILNIVLEEFVPLVYIIRYRKLMWLDHKFIKAIQFFLYQSITMTM